METRYYAIVYNLGFHFDVVSWSIHNHLMSYTYISRFIVYDAIWYNSIVRCCIGLLKTENYSFKGWSDSMSFIIPKAVMANGSRWSVAIRYEKVNSWWSAIAVVVETND